MTKLPPDFDPTEHLFTEGLKRVVINQEGVATTPLAARRDNNIEPDIIFLRDDGWTLGAPQRLAKLAHDMWADAWLGCYKRNKTGDWEYWTYVANSRFPWTARPHK
jgi:hypothetical protein